MSSAIETSSRSDAELSPLERYGATLQRDFQRTLDGLWRFVPENIRHQLRSPAPDGIDAETVPRWRVRSTLDLYARFPLNSPMRFRAKHTLQPSQFVTLKSQLTLAKGTPPEVEAELKLLGVFKYILSRSGPSLQLRVRAPLTLNRTAMDVIYERRAAFGEEVRVAFRFVDAFHVKVPFPSAAMKVSRQQNSAVKTTFRIKRTLVPPPEPRNSSNRGLTTRIREEQREQREQQAPTSDVVRILSLLLGGQRQAQPRRSRVQRPPPQAEPTASPSKSSFESTRELIRSVIQADDLSIDVKYRWLDIGEVPLNTTGTEEKPGIH